MPTHHISNVIYDASTFLVNLVSNNYGLRN